MAKRAFALALRYGQAVYELAETKDAFDIWLNDLQLLDTIVADKDILFFLESPKVAIGSKKAVLESKLTGVKPAALNLVLSLASRGRLGIIPDILDDFKRRLDDRRGIANAQVHSAVALSDKDIADIRQKLSEMFDKKVEVSASVDESLLGGVVARVGDKVIDGSLARRLQNLKQEINQARW
ncbi:MAG: ATP synthase F1 subunit delta [Dehalogenimonas sp.]